jgi:multiple sugar transport system permease protein
MIRKRTGEIIARSIAYFFLTVGALTMLVPFLWMVSTSLKATNEVFIFPPKVFGEKILWTNYLKISERFNFALYFFNSLKIAVWIVFFQLLTSAMAGFVFARLHFRFRDKIFLLYLATMMVPMHVTIITNYINLTRLGLTGSHWPLMIPPMVSAFGTFLLRQFFVTLPQSLDEAARIDGCNPFIIFFRILLPLAGPTLTTLGIFCFMWNWNDYFSPLIFLTDERLFTLPLGLATMRGMYQTNWPVLMAACTLSVIPVVIVFLAAQNAFVKGIVLTGLREG